MMSSETTRCACPKSTRCASFPVVSPCLDGVGQVVGHHEELFQFPSADGALPFGSSELLDGAWTAVLLEGKGGRKTGREWFSGRAQERSFLGVCVCALYIYIYSIYIYIYYIEISP